MIKFIWLFVFAIFTINLMAENQIDTTRFADCDKLVKNLLKFPAKYIELVNQYNATQNDNKKTNEIPMINAELFYKPYYAIIQFDSLIQKSEQQVFFCKDLKKSSDEKYEIYYYKYEIIGVINGNNENLFIEFQFYHINENWVFKRVNHTNKWHCME